MTRSRFGKGSAIGASVELSTSDRWLPGRRPPSTWKRRCAKHCYQARERIAEPMWHRHAARAAHKSSQPWADRGVSIMSRGDQQFVGTCCVYSVLRPDLVSRLGRMVDVGHFRRVRGNCCHAATRCAAPLTGKVGHAHATAMAQSTVPLAPQRVGSASHLVDTGQPLATGGRSRGRFCCA